ncbi:MULTISPECIES: hypothetical protein [Pseudescherichia]|uniref:hypothetical protein n=1 Tax=Pseudescherichia TaxID=2055880 RepID=UPI00301B9333
MKTVEILAKYLPEWPRRYARIVQGGESSFYGVLVGDELAHVKIDSISLSGLVLADDYGTSVTREEWEGWRYKHLATQGCQVALGEDKIKAASVKADDLEHSVIAEARYQEKLVSLRECLVTTVSREGSISRIESEGIADAVSAAFDKIKM